MSTESFTFTKAGKEDFHIAVGSETTTTALPDGTTGNTLTKVGFDTWWLAQGGSNTETLAGDKTLTTSDPIIHFLDPGGSNRTVTLPAEQDGLCVYIANTGSSNAVLTVKEDSNTTTIGQVSNDKTLLFICDGTSWGAADVQIVLNPGAIVFGGPSGLITQDSNLVFDNTNNYLLVGHSTSLGQHTENIQAIGGGFASARWSNDASGDSLTFAKSRNSIVGTQTSVNAGDDIGDIYWYGTDGTDLQAGARIRMVLGSPGASDMPSDIRFFTGSASSPGTLAEAMRIDALQNFLVGAEAIGTSGEKSVALGDSNVVAPSASVADAIHLWAADAAGAGTRTLRVMQEENSYIWEFPNASQATQYVVGSASYPITEGRIPYVNATQQLTGKTNFVFSAISDRVVATNVVGSTATSTGTLTASGVTTFGGEAYTWPVADGTSTYCLQTDGSGNLSWAYLEAFTQDPLDFAAATRQTNPTGAPIAADNYERIWFYFPASIDTNSTSGFQDVIKMTAGASDVEAFSGVPFRLSNYGSMRWTPSGANPCVISPQTMTGKIGSQDAALRWCNDYVDGTIGQTANALIDCIDLNVLRLPKAELQPPHMNPASPTNADNSDTKGLWNFYSSYESEEAIGNGVPSVTLTTQFPGSTRGSDRLLIGLGAAVSFPSVPTGVANFDLGIAGATTRFLTAATTFNGAGGHSMDLYTADTPLVVTFNTNTTSTGTVSSVVFWMEPNWSLW